MRPRADREEMRVEREAGLTLTEIGKRRGISRQRVWQCLYGPEPNGRHGGRAAWVMPRINTRKVARAYERGHTLAEIARACECSIKTIWIALQKEKKACGCGRAVGGGKDLTP